VDPYLVSSSGVTARVAAGLRQTFAAFSSRNYRLWFTGQIVSLTGTWMQSTAQGYLVYELTRSPAYLGLVGFANGLPSLLFMLYGGVVADRMQRRKLLVITQSAMMALAFLLAGLVATGLIQPWHIVAIAFCLGTAAAFDAPARQSFVVELVSRDDMTNAIALNSTMFNAAVIMGPAIGAAVYAALGPVWCFVLNGLSFIAVLSALLAMRLTRRGPRPLRDSAVRQLREGLRYTRSHPTIRLLIANLGLVGLLGMSLLTLLPAWSVEVLNGDVRTNGLLLSARGVGALAGALMIAALGRRPVRGRVWAMGSAFMPVALLVFGLSRWLPLSLLAMVGVGWAFMSQANTSNSLVQGRVPDELRGRVMSIYTMIFFGAMPIGSLVIGALAARIGEPATVLLGAAMLSVLAAWIWLRLPRMRRLP
jgi:predicted MFS family arabinose efflux permease